MEALEYQENGVTFGSRQSAQGVMKLENTELQGFLGSATSEHRGGQRGRRDRWSAGRGGEGQLLNPPLVEAKEEFHLVATARELALAGGVRLSHLPTIAGIQSVISDRFGIHNVSSILERFAPLSGAVVGIGCEKHPVSGPSEA